MTGIREMVMRLPRSLMHIISGNPTLKPNLSKIPLFRVKYDSMLLNPFSNMFSRSIPLLMPLTNI